VKALLAAGADADAVETGGQTALMQAASNGHASCVKALITHGCNVDAVDALGITVLITATSMNQTECMRLFLRDGGADTSITTVCGKTPLEFAISKGDANAKTIRELRRVCSVCDKAPSKKKGNINKCDAC
jgi:ankyrin repeat protein